MAGSLLKSYGVNGKLIRVLRTLYEQATSTVTVNGRRSEWFKANVGTRQGDPISPRAFIILLERLMDGTKELPEKGVTIGLHGQRVWNLRFADDIDLIDKSPTGIQEMTNKISEDSKRYGMRINTDKTKTMVNGRSMIENHKNIVLNGKAL